MALGAGCRSASQDNKTEAPGTGAAYLEHAQRLDGPEAIVVDAQTGRRFRSILPPTFRDGNGVYTTQTPNEEISVQVAVGGDPADDRERFLQITEAKDPQDLKLGTWNVTVVHDSELDRWITRATHQDPFDAKMYHIVECLSSPQSLPGFWDACRTMIEAATVEQSTQSPL